MNLPDIGPVAVSLRLDASELDHLSPLLGFLCDELGEVSRRAGKYFATEFAHPCLHRRISECRVDLPVKSFDDLGRGALGDANAKPAGTLNAWGWRIPFLRPRRSRAGCRP